MYLACDKNGLSSAENCDLQRGAENTFVCVTGVTPAGSGHVSIVIDPQEVMDFL